MVLEIPPIHRMVEKALFFPGIPGAGKTMIASIVVNQLKTSFPDDRTGRAFLFCVYERQDNQKVDGLLASLLGQLAAWQSTVPESVRKLYDKHRRGEKPRLSQDEIREALCSTMQNYSQTFIIIDALDECKTDHIRNELLSEIYKLQEESDTRLMVTFRPSVISNHPDSVTELEIRAYKEYISVAECLSYVVSFKTMTNCSPKSKLVSCVWLTACT
jgi:Cdc6-like AAA superfamily ATPase